MGIESYNGNETISSRKLQSDNVISSDVILIGDTLDLDGYTLTINGNFFHKAGVVNVNGGKLIVNGNYYMQSTATVNERSCTQRIWQWNTQDDKQQ